MKSMMKQFSGPGAGKKLKRMRGFGGMGSLMAYRVDAYVNTACPRIAMDDSARYDRPMLTVPEVEISLDLRAWDDYIFDQIR